MMFFFRQLQGTNKWYDITTEHGTGCQQNSSWCIPRQFSSVPWKSSCSRLLVV